MRVLLLGLVTTCLFGCEERMDAKVCGEHLLLMHDRQSNPLRTYAEGCAQVYRKGACRDAWMEAAREEAPEETPLSVDPRQHLVAHACAAAYCKDIDGPGAYCSGDPPQTFDAGAWSELHHAILDHELQKKPTLHAALRGTFVHVATSALPHEKPSGAVTTVFSVELYADGRVMIDGDPVSDDAAVVARAKKALEINDALRAVIRADKAVTHGRVIAMLDLLKSAGVTKIAFGVVPVASSP